MDKPDKEYTIESKPLDPLPAELFAGDSWELPTNMSTADSMQNEVMKRVVAAGWSEDDALNIGLSVREATVNAVLHGNLALEGEAAQMNTLAKEEWAVAADKKVHVTISVTPEVIRIGIRDEGAGFKPDEVVDPTLPQTIEEKHGRGMLLMRAFVDEVRYNDAGNEVTLIKRKSTS